MNAIKRAANLYADFYKATAESGSEDPVKDTEKLLRGVKALIDSGITADITETSSDVVNNAIRAKFDNPESLFFAFAELSLRRGEDPETVAAIYSCVPCVPVPLFLGEARG